MSDEEKPVDFLKIPVKNFEPKLPSEEEARKQLNILKEYLGIGNESSGCGCSGCNCGK